MDHPTEASATSLTPEALAALLENEARFRGIFENAGVGIALFDTEGTRLQANKAYCELFGYTLGELLSLSVLDLLHPDDGDQAQRLQRFKDLIQRGGPGYTVERRFLRRDGTTAWHSVTISVQQDVTGKPTFAISVIQDVTARKRLEVELVQARQQAEAASQAKDEFLANVSHELRTPMTAIIGMTELLLASCINDDHRRNLGMVRSAADHMLRMIGELLDFAKIGAGKLELSPAAFSLRSVMGEAGRAMAVRAQRRGLSLAFDVDPAVPELLVGDAGRLQQVLVNLVDNGIKFTDEGEVVVRARLIDWSDPNRVGIRFEVRDTGIGIHPDRQARIFQPFEQGDNSITRRYGGTGLGLSIASQLAGLMGGMLRVESEPGKGSTFSFTAWFGRVSPGKTPQLPALRTGAAGARPAAPSGTAADFGRPLCILVAEDNEFNTQFLQVLLSHAGHEVRVARDGRAALEMADPAKFDVMLLDLHMPEVDGFEVVARLRARERRTGERLPIIALTARAHTDDSERCLQAGADAFLTKPVRAAELWKAVRDVIRPRGGSRATIHSVIDAATLLGACASDDAILSRICEALRRRLPGELKALREALEAGEAPRVRERAHRTFGMVSAFSSRAGAALAEIEGRAEEGSIEGLADKLCRLETMCAALLADVEHLSVHALSAAVEQA